MAVARSCSDLQVPLPAPSCLCCFQLPANLELYDSFSGKKKIVLFKCLYGKDSSFPVLLGLCLFSQQCLLPREGKRFISQPCELGTGRFVTNPVPGHLCCPQPHLLTLCQFSVLFCCSSQEWEPAHCWVWGLLSCTKDVLGVCCPRKRRNWSCSRPEDGEWSLCRCSLFRWRSMEGEPGQPWAEGVGWTLGPSVPPLPFFHPSLPRGSDSGVQEGSTDSKQNKIQNEATETLMAINEC